MRKVKYVVATYIGKDSLSFIHGHQYLVVGYDSEANLLSIVDESRENYLYLPNLFEFTEDYRKLPSEVPNVYLNNDNELELIEYEMIPHDDIVIDEDLPINLTGKVGGKVKNELGIGSKIIICYFFKYK